MKNKFDWRRFVHYGVLLFAVLFFFVIDLDPNNPKISAMLAIAVWMAGWWIAEIVPLAITSLLPVVLFPLFGIMNGRQVSSEYFNHIIFLYIGGFIVALAIQKWHLHKRIALGILSRFGMSPGQILLGVMLATGFLSMWISNTATTMMMVPILLALISQFAQNLDDGMSKKFAIGLLLAVAYSASVGGLATLVGTPPNLSFVRIFQIYFPEAGEISFGQWIFFAAPISLLLFFVVWGLLYHFYLRGLDPINRNTAKKVLKSMSANLGKMGFEEKTVSLVFVSMAVLWITRADIRLGNLVIPGWSGWFAHPAYINDGTVAVALAILLFIIPSRQGKGKYLMDWDTAKMIPWEIILLFGGGFALASGFKESGLSLWLGQQLVWLDGVHPLLLIFSICIMVTFLTELTSNTATVESLLPILAGLSLSIDVNPLLLMIPATLSSSLAFMLPVATPPNAIVFGTKNVPMIQMMRVGFWLNLIGVLVVSLMCYSWGKWIFGLS